MRSRCYQLNEETLAIAIEQEHPTTVLIPQGSTVTIVFDPPGSRLVGVLWKGKRLQMFAEDLADHGILEDANHSAGEAC
jgi:hypothetical protein